jgi:hypothetical protein
MSITHTMIHPTPLDDHESNTATDDKLDATHLEAGHEHSQGIGRVSFQRRGGAEGTVRSWRVLKPRSRRFVVAWTPSLCL